ncbi:MAG: hypothetical protein GY809_31895 [Planctomycetes bacterium]|nr:hypothetical protein [Planctomycetota bacterium]
MSYKLGYVILAVLMASQVMTGMAGAADASLVGWWKLDDGSGTVVKDSSVDESHGTLNGDGVWVEGVLGGALQFDGATTYVEIPAGANQGVINNGDFSMMAWIKTTNISGTKYMFQQGDGGGTGRSWLFTVNGEITTYVGVGNFGSGVTMELDEWYHAGFTVIEGGDSDTLQMYVNGEAAGAEGTRAMETCAGGYFMGTHKGLATGTRWPGDVDDVRLYNRALTAEQFQKVMIGAAELAGAPAPANEQTDVLRNAVLTWEPGEFAATHDVYFGTSFEDVNGATVPSSAGQAATSFDPGGLAFDQVYYWRVDEVNGTPDKTVFKGDVWRFTAEPYSIEIPAAAITVTASSSSNESSIPEKTIDGSGLDPNTGTHDINPETMWFTASVDLDPWIQYEFEGVEKLDAMTVWNANSSAESAIGWGVKDVQIQYSVDGENWEALADTTQFSRAPGLPTYDAYDEIAFGGVAAKMVRLKILSNWGGILMSYGLSEVKFSVIPAQARTPQPASGSTDILPDSTLTWRAGREAAQHTVYISSDMNAVAEGSAPSVTSTTNSVELSSLSLELGEAYYWRVDEVNQAEAVSVWAGPVWNFSTVAALTVDDFESYNNSSPDRPFQTWLDGFGYSSDESFPVGYPGNGTGAGIGHDIWSLSSPHYDGDIMETGNTMAGSGQSMPFYYTNTGGVASQTERTFAIAQDWTVGGVQTLSIAFTGQVGNTGTLYVKINDTKVTYGGAPENLTLGVWQAWNIDLSGMNVQSVTTLQIGVEGGGASGMLLIDDIRLYGEAGEVITPVDPGTANLAGAWSFDEGSGTVAADSSGNGLTGTLFEATWEPGVQGSALSFNDTGYVETGYAGIPGTGARTCCAWIKTIEANRVFVSWGLNTAGKKWRMRLDATGGLRIEVNGGYNYGQTFLADDEWHHTAIVLADDGTPDCSETRLYVDGHPETTRAVLDEPIDTDPAGEFRIGRSTYDNAGFIGLIDEVHVYERALSDGEILSLAGKTTPIDKPF